MDLITRLTAVENMYKDLVNRKMSVKDSNSMRFSLMCLGGLAKEMGYEKESNIVVKMRNRNQIGKRVLIADLFTVITDSVYYNNLSDELMHKVIQITYLLSNTLKGVEVIDSNEKILLTQIMNECKEERVNK